MLESTGGKGEGLLLGQGTEDEEVAVKLEHDKCARRLSVKALVTMGVAAVLVLVGPSPTRPQIIEKPQVACR